MAKITKKLVDSLQPDPSRDLWTWDNELPGFGVRVWPSGRKVYVAQYRAGGRTRRMGLGTHGVVTPEQARKEAMQILANVAKGLDPADTRDKGRHALTMRDLAQRYFEEHAKAKKKPSSIFRDSRLIERFILPALGSRKIEEVDRATIARLHHRVGKETPTQANRLLSCLSKMFTLAITWGLRPDMENPCRYIERFKENKRERYLSGEELARLGAVLAKVEAEGQESPSTVNAIRLMLLTGARMGEALGLRWEYVDWERSSLRLPDSKTGPKTIPLGTAAVNLLQSLPRHPGNPHVFPGLLLGDHLKDLFAPWKRIRERVGLEGVRLHDLRHTWASMGAASGLSLPLIGAVLGHSEPSTTQRYSHLANDPLKQAADLVAGKVAEALIQPLREKVVPLPKRS